MRVRRFIIPLLALWLAPSFLPRAWPEAVKDEPPLGHSAHGQAFSEGPRQAARIIPGCGDLRFPVSTSSEAAQAMFNQGVGQLHGFWFFEAERSFRQVLKLDPECLMAYWGIAMANVENVARGHKVFEALDRPELTESWELLPEREQRLIESVRTAYAALVKAENHRQPEPWRQLVRDWEAWLNDHPEELEMKAFLVGLIWRNAYRHNVPISSHRSVAALANEVLAVNPAHPVHHYVIHLWDEEAPRRALDSARQCGQAAPGIAHMWHMPSHIYSKLNRYADAAWHQEASSRVDHAHMIADRVMPEEIFNYVHNQGWLVDSLSHIGRVDEAMRMARNLIELPRIPSSSALDESADQTWTEARSGYRAGRTRLMRLLWTWEAWAEALEWSSTPWLEEAGDDAWLDQRHWLLGTAALRTGHTALAEDHLAALRDRLADLERRADDAAEQARTANDELKEREAAKAATDARRPFERRLTDLRRAVGELEALQHLLAGDRDAAVARFDELKGIDDLRSVRWLIETGRPNDAITTAQRLADRNKGQVAPLVEWVRAAHAAGDADALNEAFRKLRPLAAQADLHAAPLARLQSIAEEMGFESDWRLAEPSEESLARPAIETLGPLAWHPPLAPEWNLSDADGRAHSNEDFQQQPYLLIFFLGRECLHCMEQLNAFAPEVERFAALGLPIVAVSTDSAEGLRKTFRTIEGGTEGTAPSPFPFPLVGDDQGIVFRSFRAWDDFEDTALHGTFLIDGEGRVRWQHISFEPFMEVEFLLEEAGRLLRIPAAPIPAPAPVADGLLTNATPAQEVELGGG